MADLTTLTDGQLRARHLFFMAEIRVAQAAGDKDEAYRLAQDLRRMNAEMSLRIMCKAA